MLDKLSASAKPFPWWPVQLTTGCPREGGGAEEAVAEAEAEAEAGDGGSKELENGADGAVAGAGATDEPEQSGKSEAAAPSTEEKKEEEGEAEDIDAAAPEAAAKDVKVEVGEGEEPEDGRKADDVDGAVEEEEDGQAQAQDDHINDLLVEPGDENVPDEETVPPELSQYFHGAIGASQAEGWFIVHVCMTCKSTHSHILITELLRGKDAGLGDGLFLVRNVDGTRSDDKEAAAFVLSHCAGGVVKHDVVARKSGAGAFFMDRMPLDGSLSIREVCPSILILIFDLGSINVGVFGRCCLICSIGSQGGRRRW